MSLEAGVLLGPYRVQALLGAGGMGEVYRARDTRLGRDAALKVISPKLLADPSLRRRFELEARAASVLNHPAIVTIYDVGETGDVAWIAMEWVEGHTLREILSGGPLPLEQTIGIAHDIAQGLAAAHAKGVVHRDLKPENIMLRPDGRAKILDFGLARQTIVDSMQVSASEVETTPAAGGAATVEGTIVGTVGYMSPEQTTGRAVDFRSDQFAFGLIVYEMLTGRRAFARASAVETLAAIIRDEPPPASSLRAGIPEPLQRLIERCLAKAPEERFASTDALASALASIRGGAASGQMASTSSVSTQVRDAVSPPRTRLSRRSAIVGGAALLVLAIGAAAGWMWVHSRAGPIRSLAVLPFENAVTDPNAEYLGTGMTETLIDQLSRVPSLKVTARTTVMRLRNVADPLAAARQLGVGAVLVGTIAKRDSQIIVSAELVDIPTGARLWGQTYDRPASDLLRVQDSIVLEIVDGLRLRLRPDQKRRLVARTTQNLEAYELFLKARFLLEHDNEEDDLEARRLFLQAIDKDPKFADAYLGVGTTYARSAGNGYAHPIEAWSRASDYARKALELDPGSFGARVALAVRHFQFDWDWQLAEREFGQLSTDPRLFVGLGYHPAAVFAWVTGRPDQSVLLVERGLEVDPRNVESRLMLAGILAESGRLDDSIRHYRAIIRDEPADARPLFGLADILRQRGDDPSGAIAVLRKAYELADEQAGVDALAGARSNDDYDRAQLEVAGSRLRELQELSRQRYVSPLDLGRLYAKTGRTNEAIAALELALREKSPGLVFLHVDRMWDSIRDDPRFASIVQKVGLQSFRGRA